MTLILYLNTLSTQMTLNSLFYWLRQALIYEVLMRNRRQRLEPRTFWRWPSWSQLRVLSCYDFISFPQEIPQAVKEEHYLLTEWLKKVPNCGTLMELATIKLRKQLTCAQFMEVIGERELDPVVKFYTQDI